MLNKMILKLQNKKAEIYTDKVVWTLAIIIVGIFLMWGVYAIFEDTVLVELDNSIKAIFTTANTIIGERPTA